MTDLDDASAVETAAAVRSGRISALEACDAAISRIEKRDGPINAIVVRDFERARAAARDLDADKARKAQAPLAGVPMTIKESHNLAGLPTSWGFPPFKDLPIREDSTAVQRLKAAGVIILGKSNVSVMLADWQADNPIYGRTNNPFDLSRTPGGSSGGAAAALAARMVPLEFGSDIGGSIRVPAACCGVFGHKPTFDLVPMKGHQPPVGDGAGIPLAVVGPMARTGADLDAALQIVAGPLEPSLRLDLPAPRCAMLRGARALVLSNNSLAPTDAEVSGAIATLADALRQHGAEVQDDHPDLPDLAEMHTRFITMVTTVTTRSAPGAKASIDAFEWLSLLDIQAILTRTWRRIFNDVDVVLMPTFGRTAFPHTKEPDWSRRTMTINGEATRYGAQLGWPGVALFPGLPSTAAPIGLSREGLPLSVQIMGAPYADRTTIGFAQLLEHEGLARSPRPHGC